MRALPGEHKSGGLQRNIYSFVQVDDTIEPDGGDMVVHRSGSKTAGIAEAVLSQPRRPRSDRFSRSKKVIELLSHPTTANETRCSYDATVEM